MCKFLFKAMRYSFAGLLATFPMTLWMLAGDRLLPHQKEERLPPEEITKNIADTTGLEAVKNHKPTREAVSTINHYMVGAAAALPFLLLGKPSVGKGVFYGFLVWFGNYAGILPNLHLYPPATQKSARMNTLMLVAHLIWGASLGKNLS